MQDRLTILNHYDLKASADEFTRAIVALVRRVEAEGDPGIISYRFFVNETEGAARGIIDYQTPQAWIGHHDIAMDWPEMKDLHNVAALSEVTFLGPLTDDIRDWIAKSTLTARIQSGNSFTSGFQR